MCRDTLPVYNCASGDQLVTTQSQILDIGLNGICEQIPIDKMIWFAKC